MVLHSLKRKVLRSVSELQYTLGRPKIIARTACLGTDLISRIKLNAAVLHHQKLRVDYSTLFQNCPEKKCQPSRVVPHLARNYIEGCIYQLRNNFFGYTRPDLIIMDSFSELTDQLFIHRKNNWQFLANYSDIRHDSKFQNTFECIGLLQEELLEAAYLHFFDTLKKCYPDVPIIFIHFPTTLETREKFRKRGEAIQMIIEKIAAGPYDVHSISVPDEQVWKATDESDELKDFPYHYHNKTMDVFLKKLINTLEQLYEYKKIRTQFWKK